MATTKLETAVDMKVETVAIGVSEGPDRPSRYNQREPRMLFGVAILIAR